MHRAGVITKKNQKCDYAVFSPGLFKYLSSGRFPGRQYIESQRQNIIVVAKENRKIVDKRMKKSDLNNKTP